MQISKSIARTPERSGKFKEENSYARNDYSHFGDFVVVGICNQHGGKFNTFAFSRCVSSSYTSFSNRQKGCLAY